MCKKPTHRKHNPYHDYSSRCIYHITLVVSDRVKIFGHMVDALRLGGRKPDGVSWTERELAESAKVQFTPLGLEVWRAIQGIPAFEATKGNEVQILAACVMPEHIHFCLFVKKPSKRPLGLIIRGFKQGCNKALMRYLDIGTEGSSSGGAEDLKKVSVPNGEAEAVCSPSGLQPFSMATATVAAMAAPAPFVTAAIWVRRRVPGCENAGRRILEDHALFEEDFDETRLRRHGQLTRMIEYVHNNPRHRWLRDHKPQWLLPVRGIEIAGRKYDAIGNVNLLALRRFQIHCRYRWEKYNDVESRRNHQNDGVRHARQNYALVSPFIMDHEAAVRDHCLREGHSVIQLCDNGLSDLQQCPGGLYDYCVNGQVLLLAPSGWPHIDNKGRCSRQECNILNGYAQEIVEEA